VKPLMGPHSLNLPTNITVEYASAYSNAVLITTVKKFTVFVQVWGQRKSLVDPGENRSL
jgi:hypothetical protein